MSQQIRFNHVFLVLLALSMLSSLVFPPAVGDAARGKIDNLFIPVAMPVRRIAAMLDSRFTAAPAAPKDKDGRLKTPAELQDEIESLKFQLVNVTKELEDLSRKTKERAKLGVAADSSRTYSVVAGDSGTRQTLSLKASSFDSLRPDMPVIYPQGLVGKLQNTSVGAARVLLLTDPGFKPAVQCEFRRYLKDTGIIKLHSAPFAVGPGESGTLRVTTFKWSDVKASDLQVGDTVNLADHDWPDVVQGLPLGDIVSITQQRKNNLFADIVIKPKTDLMKLKEVMVVVRK